MRASVRDASGPVVLRAGFRASSRRRRVAPVTGERVPSTTDHAPIDPVDEVRLP